MNAADFGAADGFRRCGENDEMFGGRGADCDTFGDRHSQAIDKAGVG